ncbi:MAG: leucyl aminopeptidase [Candidatus Magasanikbacteria bacterium]|nr:leucyl aminopeptidase [Candidatus Magasanikbacteria bacterium]
MIKYLVETTVPETACLAVPLWEGKNFEPLLKQVHKEQRVFLKQIVQNTDFEGKKLQTVFLYTNIKRLPRILLLGLGKEKDFNIKIWKQVAGSAATTVQSKKLDRFIFLIPQKVLSAFGPKKAGTETVCALSLAEYIFDTYKEKESRETRIEHIGLLLDLDQSSRKNFEKGMEEGIKISEAVNLVRSLGNMSPSEMIPERLASEALKIAKSEPALSAKILSEPEIKKLGMGCFLGVSSGSQHEAKFIIFEYRGTKKTERSTVLIGKGITFDSGGLSIKPSDFMCDMKYDMLGAATMMGVMKAAASLGLKRNLIGLAPVCENMPGSKAYRPDDILRAMNGKTVEVKNTDAEGRLILADALCYAKRYNPKEVLDLATLTGACMVALGLERSGLFSPEDSMAEKLYHCSQTVGEELWRLPLGEEYTEMMKSDVADIANISKGRYGGASSGAAFLEFFVDYPWAHIDMASAYMREPKPWIRLGANGFGVQTLVEYLR